jgi:glycosyltransferase involved in cell wall biosynthesis
MIKIFLFSVSTLTILTTQNCSELYQDAEQEIQELIDQKDDRIRLAIDGVFYQNSEVSGIARVWNELLKIWQSDEEFKDFDIFYLKREGTNFPKMNVSPKRLISMRPFAYGEQNQLTEETNLQVILENHRIDIFMSTYYSKPLNNHFPYLALLYDMIPEITDIMHDIQFLKKKWFSNASRALSISEYSANLACEVFYKKSAPCKKGVTIAYPGVDPNFTLKNEEEIKKTLNKYDLMKKYFLFVGLGDGYKNCELIAKTLAQYPDEWFDDYDFVQISGKPNCFKNEFFEKRSSNYRFLSNLSNQELQSLYAGAHSVVYPSRHEGFGLPIVESQASGVPIIIQRTSVLPEIAGEAAIYYEENTPQSLYEAMKKSEDISLREEIIEKGLELSKEFTWLRFARIMADEIRAVYADNYLNKRLILKG